MEEWRDIRGFPGYQVSDCGNVRTHNKVTSSARYPVRHWADRILRQKIHHKDHYLRVDLWKDGVPHTALVHRLVAEEFIPNGDRRLTVNHIDGNKSNNCRENLEWVSLVDNIRHAFKTGLMTAQHSCTITNTNGIEKEFRSLSEASRYIGRSTGYISGRIKRGGKITSSSGEIYAIR